MRFIERLRWLGRLFVLLFVLGSAAFLSAITAMRLAIEGRVVQMPNLVGRSFSNAQTELRFRNLAVVVADHVYSDLPADGVVRQSPPPGTQIKVGQAVEVVLSLGVQRISIPNLVDRSLPAARLQLLTSGLHLGEVSYIYSSGEPADLILQQDPLPGQAGLASPRVSVLVSLGPHPEAYVMPDLIGLTASEADGRLGKLATNPPAVTFVPYAGATVGTVVSQNPPPGARVDQTTPVQIGVSSMAEPSPPATRGGPAQPPVLPRPPPKQDGPA